MCHGRQPLRGARCPHSFWAPFHGNGEGCNWPQFMLSGSSTKSKTQIYHSCCCMRLTGAPCSHGGVTTQLPLMGLRLHAACRATGRTRTARCSRVGCFLPLFRLKKEWLGRPICVRRMSQLMRQDGKIGSSREYSYTCTGTCTTSYNNAVHSRYPGTS